jgi:C4-dicarboxylate-specific signal transduction histidine kinase
MAGIFALLKGLNWIRIALLAGIAVSIFGLGYMYSDKQHAEHEADVQKQITAAVVAKEKKLREEFRARLDVERAARTMLENDLFAIRANRDQLIEAVRLAQLTKPVSAITVEGCMESDDENVRVVLGNPFTDDFVRLWNDASRGRLSGTDPDTEAR